MRNVICLLTLTIFFNCSSPESDFFTSYNLGLSHQEEKTLLIPLLTSKDYDYNFARFDQLSQRINEKNEDQLILLLSDYLNKHPEDPYQAYYLLRIAFYYLDQHSEEMAKLYFQRILDNTEDINIHGQSIHLNALNKLLEIVDKDEEKIPIYDALISRFSERVNLGQCHYFLGRSYENLGLWDRAYEEYNNFLQYRDTEIPGVVNGYEMVRQRVNFHNSSKNWTFQTRDDLVNSIKYAIRTRKIYLLNRYRSNDFFVLSWSQKMEDTHQVSVMEDLTSYSKSNLRYNIDLEPFSNNQEAYLKTWGWSYRVRSWYLYFRRINYPADPEINGRWEWAGIYLGDPL